MLRDTPPEECVRIVCISDTHCEHKSLTPTTSCYNPLALPDGDILIHAGDCLCESGLRHATRTPNGIEVHSAGEALLEQFAAWFGSLRFLHKVLVGGNHDLVMQGLGKTRVRELFARHCTFGTVHYLEHETAQVGPLKIFGSPFGTWGSHNDAFAYHHDLADGPDEADVVVTHTPCVLPRKRTGGLKEDARVAAMVRKCGARLHVGGHCHWAYGVYTLPGTDVPCVVASTCGEWEMPWKWNILRDARLDKADWKRGGYSAAKSAIVCDLRVHGAAAAEVKGLLCQNCCDSDVSTADSQERSAADQSDAVAGVPKLEVNEKTPAAEARAELQRLELARAARGAARRGSPRKGQKEPADCKVV